MQKSLTILSVFLDHNLTYHISLSKEDYVANQNKEHENS